MNDGGHRTGQKVILNLSIIEKGIISRVHIPNIKFFTSHSSKFIAKLNVDNRQTNDTEDKNNFPDKSIQGKKNKICIGTHIQPLLLNLLFGCLWNLVKIKYSWLHGSIYHIFLSVIKDGHPGFWLAQTHPFTLLQLPSVHGFQQNLTESKYFISSNKF